MLAPIMRWIDKQASQKNLSSAQAVRLLANFWPPFVGAGIKILEISPDYKLIRVCLKRSWANANYVGVQFGGSMFAMSDPFYMLMLIHNLGPQYRVWDKSSCIDFLKPGRTRLFVEFRIDDALLAQIRHHTDGGQKYLFDREAEIKDASGETVARVIKTIYVRQVSAKPK